MVDEIELWERIKQKDPLAEKQGARMQDVLELVKTEGVRWAFAEDVPGTPEYKEKHKTKITLKSD